MGNYGTYRVEKLAYFYIHENKQTTKFSIFHLISKQ